MPSAGYHDMHDSEWILAARIFVGVEAVAPAAFLAGTKILGVDPFEVVYFGNVAFLLLVWASSVGGATAGLCLPEISRPDGVGKGKSILLELLGSSLMGAFLGVGLSDLAVIRWLLESREISLAVCCFAGGFAGPAAVRYAMPIGKRAMDWFANKWFPKGDK